jgi:hypothetical protein
MRLSGAQGKEPMQNWSAILLSAVLPLLAAPVHAQDRAAPPHPTPKIELFTGYEERMVFGDRGIYASAPRWQGHMRISVDVNMNDRIALVLSDPKLGIGTSISEGTWVDYGFLAGPRLRFRQQHRVMPFVQLLAGVDHGVMESGTIPVSPFEPRDRRTFFQSAIGGGVDVTLGRRLAWRAFQIEERSRFGAPDANHRLSVSSGVVFRFGVRK